MAGGMRGMDPRHMQKAMRQMGIKQTSIEDVIEVVIRTKKNDIVITDAEVMCVDMKGNKSYQISGTEEVRATGSTDTSAPLFPSEDIDLVMNQTGCDREKAIKALTECDGQPAEAIIKVISG